MFSRHATTTTTAGRTDYQSLAPVNSWTPKVYNVDSKFGAVCYLTNLEKHTPNLKSKIPVVVTLHL